MRTVNGTIKLHNGISIKWQQFIESANSQEEAEQRAMEIVSGQHNEPIENCSIDGSEQPYDDFDTQVQCEEYYKEEGRTP